MLIYNLIFDSEISGGAMYTVPDLEENFKTNILNILPQIILKSDPNLPLDGISIKGSVNYNDTDKYLAEFTFGPNDNINTLQNIEKWNLTNYDSNSKQNVLALGDELLNKLRINIGSLQNISANLSSMFPSHSGNIETATNLLSKGMDFAKTKTGQKLKSTLGKILKNTLSSSKSLKPVSSLTKLSSVLTGKPSTTKSSTKSSSTTSKSSSTSKPSTTKSSSKKK